MKQHNIFGGIDNIDSTGEIIKEKTTMNNKEIQVEMQILATLFLATNDQKLMVEGHLKKEAKRDLNIWISQGKKLLKDINIKGNGEDYYSVMTDVIHDQMEEVRKAFKQINK